MNIVFILLPLAFILSIGFLLTFLFRVSQGDFDDLDTPAYLPLQPEKDAQNQPQEVDTRF